MVLMGTGGGGNYRQTPRRGGALGDRIKCLCRGDWIHGISHLPVQGRRASLAPVRLTLVSELCMLRAQLGRWGGARSDQGTLPDSARILASSREVNGNLRDSMESSGPAPSRARQQRPRPAPRLPCWPGLAGCWDSMELFQRRVLAFCSSCSCDRRPSARPATTRRRHRLMLQ